MENALTFNRNDASFLDSDNITLGDSKKRKVELDEDEKEDDPEKADGPETNDEPDKEGKEKLS
jgi:hypothetical protein